jgi:hypothetical protein
MKIENLIAEANPVPLATVADGDSAHALRTLAQIMASDQREAPSRDGGSAYASGGGRPGRGAARTLRRVAVGLTVAAAAAALVTTQLVPRGHEGRKDIALPPASGGGKPGTLAAALDSLSLAADAQPVDLPPGPGQFEYTDESSLNWIDTYNNSPTTSYNVSYTELRQIWIGSDGSGRLVETYSNPQLGTAKDRAGWIAAGRPSLAVPPADSTFGAGQLSDGPPDLNRLPADPAKLAALLVARKIEGGPKGPAEDFVQIGDMLRENYVRPALRAAIFAVAEHIPGVQLLGTVTDQVGRSGIGLAYVRAYPAQGEIAKSVLVFDPKTSKMIAEESLVTNTETGKTTLMAWTDYLKSGVVNSQTSTNPESGAGASSG